MKPLSSSFAFNIAGLIRQKQTDGLKYSVNAESLAVFDTFCVENGYNDGILTRKIIDHWSEQRKTENLNSSRARITVVRQLALYMLSQGIETYLPPIFWSEDAHGHKRNKKCFSSVFAPYILALIKQRRDAGFKFEFEAACLLRFDRFCINNGYVGGVLTREVVMNWAIQLPTEGLSARNDRVKAVRALAHYLLSLGMDAYMPMQYSSRAIGFPHIFTSQEMTEFFDAIDHSRQRRPWLALEYPVLFRLFYCCGLRLAEACNLKRSLVDLSRGTIRIFGSKGLKDRLVFLSEDVKMMCRAYDKKLDKMFPDREWFFPSPMFPDRPYPRHSLCKKFQEFWGKTKSSHKVDRRPTIHCFRHGFVIARVNEWFDSGQNIDAMIPYLSRYLGHDSVAETYYYFKFIDRAFPEIRNRVKKFDGIVPEADYGQD
jgi:integrase